MGDIRGVRVTLADHKAVVKSWRARPNRCVNHNHGDSTRGMPGHSQSGSSQWHREKMMDLSENDNRESVSVCVDDESVVDTFETLLSDEHEHDDAETIHLRSVGQIKHAYRARARREEGASERKALQKQLEQRKVRCAATKSAVPSASTSVQPTIPQESELEESQNQDNRSVEEDGSMRLDSQSLVSSAEYRTDVLRAVRSELSAGRDVVVVVHTVLAVSVADVKLAVQQLCAESLLFCTRDQNVLPTVDHERELVTLELLARHR